MCFKITARIILMLGFFSSTNLNAYDEDVHYTVTSLIMKDRLQGRTLDAKNHNFNDYFLLVPMSNQYIDEDSNTWPTASPWGGMQRRQWHFPALVELGYYSNSYYYVKRGDQYASYLVRKALNSIDPGLGPKSQIFLGMALHVYMDSYSHEGYGARYGHASAGHDPDRPHLSTDKFREMVSKVYSILGAYFTTWFGYDLLLSTIPPSRYQIWADFHVWEPVFNLNYYSTAVVPRIDHWMGIIKANYPYWKLPQYSGTFIPGNRTWKDLFDSLASDPANQLPFSLPDNQAWAQVSPSQVRNGSLDHLDVNPSKKTNFFNITNASRQELRRAVKELFRNPDLALHGLPPVLNTRRGVNEIFRFANHRKDRWISLLSMSSNAHGTGPDWQPYVDLIRPLMRTKNYNKRIFATTTLTAFRDDKKATCRSINAFYNSLNMQRLTEDQADMLIASLTADSHYASRCTTSTIRTLERLTIRGIPSGLPDAVAARLYQISADEERQQEYLNKPSEILAMVDIRNQAKARLQAFAFPMANGGIVRKASFNGTDASSIEYWANLALEDFDDQAPASSSDQSALQTLYARLKSSVLQGNKESLLSIASALATYETNDNPPPEIITTLESALQDDRFHDIRVDLGYALEKITGVPQPLEQYWN